MKRILLSLAMIAIISGAAVGATRANFSDTETSFGNTFTAGTLDLNVDDKNENIVKFTVANIRPGNQPIGTWKVNNVGTIPGYLDLENIVLTNSGGTYTDPEGEAGDPGNAGNLGQLLDISLFVDVNGNGWFGAEDTMIYTGTFAGLASNYEQNLLLAAGGSNNITLQVNWHSHAGLEDNKGQGDVAQLDLTFELGQFAVD